MHKTRLIPTLPILLTLLILTCGSAIAQQTKPDTTKTVRDTLQLEEVVISTGYQTIPKERATGSFVFVDSALLNRAVSTDIISRLKGVVPSLLFDERAGGEPKLSIRGRSTIFANADPLIVVDNFPYEGDIRNINPNDVESVSILRDAAAASIWGVRAGNGVIVITTKKGKAGQPLQVSFNGNVTVGAKPDLWYEPRISPADQIEVERFLFERGHYNRMLSNTIGFPLVPPTVSVLAEVETTDAEKQRQLAELAGNDIRRDIEAYMYRRSMAQRYALGFKGGGDRHRYYLSTGFDRDLDAKLGNGRSRLTLTARHDIELTDALKLETGIFLSGHRQDYNHAVDELLRPIGVTTKAFTYLGLVDGDGVPAAHPRDFTTGFVDRAPLDGFRDWSYVPLEELGYGRHTREALNVRVNSGVGYRLAPGLSASVRFQYETETAGDERLRSGSSYYARDLANRFSAPASGGGRQWNVPVGDILDLVNGRLASYSFRPLVSYDHDGLRHAVNLLAGFEAREMRSLDRPTRHYGYDADNGTSVPVNLDSLYRQSPGGGTSRMADLFSTSVSGGVERFRSWYANGAYTYGRKITASASVRFDQTNLFGVRANQRSIPLWSAGLKWDLSDLAGMLSRGGKSPSRLSLRASYGYSGNFDPTATALVTAGYAVNGYSLREAQLRGMPNPGLRGERNGVLNVGLDFGWPSLSGSIDYYRREGTDLIGDMALDATYGRNIFRGNVASMSGGGMDLTLDGRYALGHFGWAGQLLASYVTDRVTHYGLEGYPFIFSDASLSGPGEMNPLVGRPLLAVYSYPWAGLDPQNGAPVGYLDGRESRDYARIRSDYGNLVYHGRATPAVYGSLRNGFSWRRFDLSVNITYKLGYYFRRASSTSGTVIANGAYSHPDFASRWQAPGDELVTHVPAFSYPVNQQADNFYVNSSVLVERGDHIRMQDARLSYRLPDASMRRAGLRGLGLFLHGNDLFMLWRANRHGVDPDYNANPRLGRVNMPSPRTVSMGVNVSI